MNIKSGRTCVLIALTALAMGLSTTIGEAQQTNPAFVYHGSISIERQNEIEAQYEAVASWFEKQYEYRPTSFTIQIGETPAALVDVLGSAGQSVPDGVGPCFWRGNYGYLLVDGCEDPLPFARVHVSEVAIQLTSTPGATIEPGHFGAGPAWLVHGAEEFGASVFRASEGQDDFASQRRRHIDRISGYSTDLAQLEVTTNFWGTLHGRSVAWLAVDQLTQTAGPDSYVDFFRQRGMHARWQDAFQAAFGLGVGEFYELFHRYVAEPEIAVDDAAVVARRDHWWEFTEESGRTVEIRLKQRGQFLNWYGIDTPISQFLEWYPSVDLVAQWSPSRRRFIGAIRGVPSTWENVPDLRRNTAYWVVARGRPSQTLQLPAPVHNRVMIDSGGSLIPWLGASETPMSEAQRAIEGLEITMVQPTHDPATQHTRTDAKNPALIRGDVLWVISPISTRWVQGSTSRQFASPVAATTAEETLALLEDDEIAEIAQSELTISAVAGTVEPRDLDVIQARLADGIAFFRERFDTPVILIEVNVHGSEIIDGVPCGDAGINVYLWCRDWTVTGLGNQPASSEMMIHEYFHRLQRHWNSDFATSGGAQILTWLVEGSAMYSEVAYWRHRGFASASNQHTMRAEHSRGVPDSLVSLSRNWPWESDLPIYALSYLAVHWLVERSGNPNSWLEFWYPWNGRERAEVFKEVFGISLDDFYREFGEWRNENHPPK